MKRVSFVSLTHLTRVFCVCMAKFFKLSLCICFAFGLFSCKKEKDEFVDLPDEVRNLVPDEVLKKFKELGIAFNDGGAPPNIEGSYFVSPLTLVKSNFPDMAPGSVYWIGNGNMNLTFSAQDSKALTVQVDYSIGDKGEEFGTGLNALMTGSGNKFSVFLEEMGTTTQGHPVKNLEMHSGEITPSGIINYQWALIVVEEASTSIKNGQGRLWKDGNDSSERK